MKARAIVVLDEVIGQVRPEILGHFAEHLGRCIYDGIYVGESSTLPNTRGFRDDVIAALKRIRPSVLRWPGGCFADDYHWRDGIGPAEQRPGRRNIHWGNAPEPNLVGTHEFVDFCRLIDAEPYICANVGSGSPSEARDWVEYCNGAAGSSLADERARNGSAEPFGVKYWGVGNELWGCGGQLNPGDYAKEVKRYSTFFRGFADDLYKIACGPRGNNDYQLRRDWVLQFFEEFERKQHPRAAPIEGFALHYYTRGPDAGGDLSFTDQEYYRLIGHGLGIEERIDQVRAAMDAYDPERKVDLIIDEWGTWHPEAQNDKGLEQQNTMRDALVAALHLDVFVRHADVVSMANIAQTVNVLQAMILTHEEQMILTPTYHAFDMYRGHQDGTSVRLLVEADELDVGQGRIPAVAGSASLKDNELFLTLTNVDLVQDVEVELALHSADGAMAHAISMITLGSQDVRDHNTFDAPDRLHPVRSEVALTGKDVRLTIPRSSVSAFHVTLS